jgi:hypothetical protein
MSLTRTGHISRVCVLVLLLAALSTGVPIRGHTHHDHIEKQVGAQGHGHGLHLVQHEMRLERPEAPGVAVYELPAVVVEPPAMFVGVPTPCDVELSECRAPPSAGPRAPPS